ncbi:chemotaxis protein CheA [Sphingomonas kaistensis]|uniref:histidine kinase n=1 Tax=Sphingomonas kaistensis TaxID=298708 RepID=A0ABZ2G313_9SPHN
MDDLIADFVSECRDMLESLGGEIVAWEAAPQDRARLDSIFRFVHTVKGNCGFFDFPRLEALSHAAEDALADVRAGRRQPDPALVSGVLAVIDRIGEMVEVIAAGSPLPEGSDDDLIEALKPGAEQTAPAAPVPATTAVSQGQAAPRTIRLSVDLLDRMMSGVSDLVLARNELARRLRDTSTDVAVASAFERMSGIIADMRDAITRTRMQRIESLFVGLPRMVRDLSAELGRQVLVDIDGGDVELDREMIEMIRDPLTHIVRNAVDHGIETPAERLKAGKREIGLLSVSARQSGNQILIDIVDDGRGIDGERLVDKAISAGILDRVEAARLGPKERLQLIFEAGLSTAKAVTSISGRGVGMDVVRSNVERIGGVVEVDSTPGQGTRMTLRVPLTLTIIPALTVSIGAQHFAIPRVAIEEIVRASGDSVELSEVGGAGLVTIRGRRVPQIVLADLLGLDSGLPDEERTLIVLKPAGGDVYALSVDRVHDHEELVVKPAAPAVMATGLYAGTTLADDGSPILLFDPAGLARVGGVRFEAQERSVRLLDDVAPNEASEAATPVLLFRDCMAARRAIRLGIVDRIEEVSGSAISLSAGRVRVQLGQDIIPLEGLDRLPAPDSKIKLFRLSDGQSQLGLAFSDVLDLDAIADQIIPAEAPGMIEGVTLVAGEPAELIDAHWLFASAARPVAEPSSSTPVCRLDLDDPWVRNMLRPIVEAAGYRVITFDTEAEADLAIASAGADVGHTARRTLFLSADADGAANENHLYRYDRAGLLVALREAAAGKNG